MTGYGWSYEENQRYDRLRRERQWREKGERLTADLRWAEEHNDKYAVSRLREALRLYEAHISSEEW